MLFLLTSNPGSANMGKRAGLPGLEVCDIADPMLCAPYTFDNIRGVDRGWHESPCCVTLVRCD